MASSERVIGYHKLETKFFDGHVQHTTYHSDALRGERLVKVVKTWTTVEELGRGSFGTVYLQRSEKEEYRAVKELAKAKNSRMKIDYRRELMAMAVLAKHDALFVQLLGWYESERYIHIAMEFINHGHLRSYLEVERSESEAKVVIRQLLEGLVVIHQEGFAHRDLKPENIFVVSKSPMWVKIGDFGLAKLVRPGTAFRTGGGTVGYIAPEVILGTEGDTSEYTNAVDIWAIGCIAHELLTGVLPFPKLNGLMSYGHRREFPREYMLSVGTSQVGMEFVESTLAYSPERRIAAEEALDSEWLRPPPLLPPPTTQKPERYDLGAYDPINDHEQESGHENLYRNPVAFALQPARYQNISRKGIEFVESTLAYPPEHRIAAEGALASEPLRQTQTPPTELRPSQNMSESGSAPWGGNKQPFTHEEISKRFKDYIEREKPGLKRFYKWETQYEFDHYLRDPVTRGLAMTKQLMSNNCPQEVAISLSLLALYDLVMLIDNSISMGICEGGARVKTLSDTLKAASAVYSFAEEGGITAVRFLNTSNHYLRVTPAKINALMKRIVFEGVTNIGTKLQSKVLVNHVTPDMAKPLLVIVLTDAEIEGEARGLLRDVIVSQAVMLKQHYGNYGPQAVAYQFAKIGNDKAAQDLVVGLADDKILGSYIDCMGDEYKLEDMLYDTWRILPKLLLGAISGYWQTETAISSGTLRSQDAELVPWYPDDGLEDDGDDDGFLTGGENGPEGRVDGGPLTDSQANKITSAGNARRLKGSKKSWISKFVGVFGG